MKTSKKFFFQNALMIVFSTAGLALAADQGELGNLIDLNTLAANGSGCPLNSGSVESAFDPNTGVLHIGLNQHQAKLVQGSQIELSTCSIALPVHLPNGKNLVITQAELGGSVDLYSNQNAQFSLDAFFASKKGVQVQKTLASAEGEELHSKILTTTPKATASDCGRDGIIRANTSVVIRQLATTAQSETTAVASANVLTLSLRLAKCR